MLLLLPPSESKAAPLAGGPVNLEALSHSSLAESRRRIANTLAKVSSQRNALRVMGVSEGLAEEVTRNVTVWSNPTDAAARVYSGVLYDAAGMARWDDAALACASQSIRIISALWGAVSPSDRVPAYRLSMSTALPRIGPLAAWWRPRLTPVLEAKADGGLIVDCRSAPYAAAYRPAQSPWVTVVVERERDGKRSIVSHNAKHTRGLLVGRLIDGNFLPETASDLADVAAGMIGSALIDVALDGNRLTLVTGE
jgi:cytoplasmic iron level regulating protein YaaA (DUF328/UPF0246 family)